MKSERGGRYTEKKISSMKPQVPREKRHFHAAICPYGHQYGSVVLTAALNETRRLLSGLVKHVKFLCVYQHHQTVLYDITHKDEEGMKRCRIQEINNISKNINCYVILKCWEMF